MVGSYSGLSELEEGEDDSILLIDSDTDGDLPPRSVLLIDAPTPEWIATALRDGVRAILPRTVSGPEIVAAIEGVAAGLIVLHPDTVQLIIPSPVNSTRDLPLGQQPSLTPREMEVLRMLAEGQGNKTIAWKLNISEHTVKFHVASIFSKLDVSTRTEAVTVGVRRGLVLL
jgi:DNA-binding NarL/FixJ family response regulator